MVFGFVIEVVVVEAAVLVVVDDDGAVPGRPAGKAVNVGSLLSPLGPGMTPYACGILRRTEPWCWVLVVCPSRVLVDWEWR